MMPLAIRLSRLRGFLLSWVKGVFASWLHSLRAVKNRWLDQIKARFAIPRVNLPGLSFPRWKMPKVKWALPNLRQSPVFEQGPAVVCLVLVVMVGLTGAAKSKTDYTQLFSADRFPFFTAPPIESEKFAGLELAQYEPAAGDPFDLAALDTQTSAQGYAVEENTLNVEGVLVPQKSTVISSSRDGKIQKIHFDDGDIFAAGDVLIEYACEDLRAEMAAVDAENNLSTQKGARGEKLFKLEIISDIERLDLQNEATKTKARKAILEARMENCEIRAAYDGRVVNRLANDNEYTRTDRVLMEVGSLDDLEVEFLVPSKWLRWVNVGAPLSLTLFETGREYTARISRIHGEVDPVSQSIQMTAALDQYDDPLLPGMSGDILIDISEIRDAGVQGYLERPAQ